MLLLRRLIFKVLGDIVKNHNGFTVECKIGDGMRGLLLQPLVVVLLVIFVVLLNQVLFVMLKMLDLRRILHQ